MNVIVGVVLAALIIGSVLVRFWPAIAALESGSAAFLGALVGAAAGLGAILVGALYNAELNRRRDDRLRQQETEALMKALASEMQVIAVSARAQAERLNQFVHNPLSAVFRLFEPPRTPVFERNADKIGWIPDAPRDQIFATVIVKEEIAATIHMIVAGPADYEIPHNTCARIAEQFDTLAGNADEAAKVLREAKVS